MAYCVAYAGITGMTRGPRGWHWSISKPQLPLLACVTTASPGTSGLRFSTTKGKSCCGYSSRLQVPKRDVTEAGPRGSAKTSYLKVGKSRSHSYIVGTDLGSECTVRAGSRMALGGAGA